MNLRIFVVVSVVARIATAQPLDPYAEPPAPASSADGPQDPYAAPPKKPAKKSTRGAKPPVPPPPEAGPAPQDPYAAPPAPAPVSPVIVAPPVPPLAPPVPSLAPASPDITTPPVIVVPPKSASRADGTVERFDLAAVQGLLAVQDLDGWLMFDLAGQNPIARSLVPLQGAPTRRWFYLVPREGAPTILCHTAEAASFARVVGARVTYRGHRDLDKALKTLLKGKKALAMEYSPRGELPSLSRVDAGTLELVRAAGVTVTSSEGLVQFAKATWGPAGRSAHYVAVHHLTELRKEAMSFLAAQLAAGVPVTERDVQVRLQKGMAMRALVGPPPGVAFGAHTADPEYVPDAERSAALVRGAPVMVSLAGKIDGGVYAAMTWVAVADAAVPAPLAQAFEAAALARDAALALVGDRVKRRRAVRGWEVDQAARDFLRKAGRLDHVVHRTGHSLDADLYGAGTDLDDLEVKDRRNLVAGTGFTVGPGLYVPGEYGVRAEVSVFLGKDGLEVTTPAQDHVEALMKAP